jgi:hypothetical protein
LGGALIGIAFPAMAQTDDARVYLGLGSIGAIGGAIAAQRMVDPPRQGQVGGLTTGDRGANRAWNLDLNLQGAAMALLKQPGRYSFVRLTF